MQDIFPVIPGDTDFRIFSKDYGKIPGLDIIFLLGGSFYHTSYDTVERLLYALHLLFWYIFTLLKFLCYSALKRFLLCVKMSPDPEASKHVEKICSA